MAAGGTNCNDHGKMYKQIIENTTILGRVDNNISDLYDKHGEGLKTINQNNKEVMEKLSELEIHFIKQDAARDRRALDNIKRTTKTVIKTLVRLIILGFTGGISYTATANLILKIWR